MADRSNSDERVTHPVSGTIPSAIYRTRFLRAPIFAPWFGRTRLTDAGHALRMLRADVHQMPKPPSIVWLVPVIQPACGPAK
jgi:hypothetical protein